MSIPLLILYASLVQMGGGSPVAGFSTTIPANGTIPSAVAFADASTACTDVEMCRTHYNIVWSSLATIFACAWTAVHRNIPGPTRAGGSRWRDIVFRVLEVMKIVAVTLLVPEWVLAWAVRQLLNARDLAKELEEARKTAREVWKAKGWMEEEDGASWKVADAEDGKAEEPNYLTDLPVEQPTSDLDRSSWVDKDIGRLSAEWTIRHGFFIIMGGFHSYKHGEPQHPLSRWDVVKLVETGELVPPTEDEIQEWSQGDALSKALAVFQTLWFVVQCIARRAEGLAIAQLEVMTLAYTVITVAMYVVWWDKPQNVRGPFRLAVKKLPEPRPAVKEGAWYVRVAYVIPGWQDDFVDLQKEPCVPTFYGGAKCGRSVVGSVASSNVIALGVAMVFGAVHCAAWYYAFPSGMEKLIWRVSSATISAVPGAMFLAFPSGALIAKLLEVVAVGDTTGGFEPIWQGLGQFVFAPIVLLSGPVYFAARILLLVLSFTTLRSLPYGVYRAVQWTLRIPHFT
ncbi:hypothetical protein BV25DRAFT_1899168 [Artomyces pyxidatus]|uniref:Uncharacterized protein n=1 Tax=Artomyces pyxidatus TaxID=48021 RepID=A0ACB8T544_9AGAM|nr:hypothetical protein BV25DRAFT_1899168 [Artomyces pyxidatus]